MEVFFFIPITKLHKLSIICDHKTVDQVIIDLEESMPTAGLTHYDFALDSLKEKEKIWVRPLLRKSFDDAVQMTQITSLINKGFKKYVLPKLIDSKEVFTILDEFREFDLTYLLLIEHPHLLLDLPKILQSQTIHAVGIGSHDFFTVTNSKNTRENLNFLRRTTLYVTKAFGIPLIDTASMEVANKDALQIELQDALDIGMDGKFFIHPLQLQILISHEFFTQEEVIWASKILTWVKEQGGVENFIPQTYQNRIIERPHVQQAIKIMKITEKWKAVN